MFSLYFTLLGLECAFPVGSFFLNKYWKRNIVSAVRWFLKILLFFVYFSLYSYKNVDIYLASKRNIPKHLWVYTSPH